jgi:phosphoribosylformylglycinamidine cyclo-ligase
VRRACTPRVLEAHVTPPHLFRLDFAERLFKRNYRDPVLVTAAPYGHTALSGSGPATTAGLARECEAYEALGYDAAAQALNDLVARGAEPLFVHAALGSGGQGDGATAGPDVAVRVTKGLCEACVDAGCALFADHAAAQNLSAVGLPLSVFALGVCELRRIVDGSEAEAGDIILGLTSSGLHGEGLDAVRALVRAVSLDLSAAFAGPEAKTVAEALPSEAAASAEPKATWAQVLLAPTRVYASDITTVLRHYRVKHVIVGMTPITGGGLPGSLPRAFGNKLDAEIDRQRWPVPPIFPFLAQHAGLADAQLWNSFNMGIGLAMVVRPAFADSIARQLRRRQGQDVHVIGRLVPGTGRVRLA